MAQTPRTEFAQALKAVATERGLDSVVVIDTIKQAIIAAYRRDAKDRDEDTEEQEFTVEINPVNGEAKIFLETKDVTPPGFGRIAAQTAKQVIHQKIREAEKGAIMDEFSDRIGTLVSGLILRFDGQNVRVDIGRTEATMPATERVPTERLSLSQRMTFLLKEIREGAHGREIILSRGDPKFPEKLFEREVPEIAGKSVIVRIIAREPGVRTKIAVQSNQIGVDPVGSCVGQKGVRVQAVTNELGGERVDIIPWTEDPKEFIKAALAPAEIVEITLDKKTQIAHVIVPEDQLSLAIGKEGQNARLASKLTGWKIEVEKIEKKEPLKKKVAKKKKES
ncbi:transcription termination factor NusA [Candidatus Woesebacteria bacterium]|nr:transcription termination factor NusA [Candidatus Woesebacteria bacterium]